MRKASVFIILTIMSIVSFKAIAQDFTTTTSSTITDDDHNKMVVGSYLGLGMTKCLGSMCEDIYRDDFRFAPSVAVYFDYHLNPMLALDFGLGILRKGGMEKVDNAKNGHKITGLEIPVGIKFNYNNIQLGAGIILFLAIAGEGMYSDDAISYTAAWADYNWNNNKRFNMGPKFFAGYAIKVGQIDIVPGLEWSVDLLNNAKGYAKDNDMVWRYTNIMFRIGMDFALK